MPPATAASPTIGESGMLWCFSAVSFDRADVQDLLLRRIANTADGERDDAEDDQQNADELHSCLPKSPAEPATITRWRTPHIADVL